MMGYPPLKLTSTEPENQWLGEMILVGALGPYDQANLLLVSGRVLVAHGSDSN